MIRETQTKGSRLHTPFMLRLYALRYLKNLIEISPDCGILLPVRKHEDFHEH